MSKQALIRTTEGSSHSRLVKERQTTELRSWNFSFPQQIDSHLSRTVTFSKF